MTMQSEFSEESESARVTIAKMRLIEADYDEIESLRKINGELLAALKAYMFIEQTDAGRNPHPVGTNKYQAFELGHAAIAKAEKEGIA